MFSFSFHFSLFNNLSIFPEKPKLAQLMLGIYNKNYYKNYRVFLRRYSKGRSILEYIKHHNLCPKGLVHFDDRLAEHDKNKASKNTKISRNTISLITPKGVHNYITHPD